MSTVGPTIRRLVTAELRLYGTVLPWLLRRSDAPPRTAAFGYVGVIRPVLWAFIVLSAIEAVVLHVLLPWPAVRLHADDARGPVRAVRERIDRDEEPLRPPE